MKYFSFLELEIQPQRNWCLTMRIHPSCGYKVFVQINRAKQIKTDNLKISLIRIIIFKNSHKTGQSHGDPLNNCHDLGP